VNARCLLAGIGVALAFAPAARAHPLPFSTIDLRVEGQAIEVAVTAHAVDLARALSINPVERLLARAGDIGALLSGRVRVQADGASLSGGWSTPEMVPSPVLKEPSLRLRARYAIAGAPARVILEATLFPHDPAHQTFVNVYEGEALRTQAILDQGRPRLEHFTGGGRGLLAVARKFVGAGIHHILIGADHLLFLVGLLLLGGTLRQLVVVVSAFTLGHSVTLTLAALRVLSPPASVIEPAIALSIVFVGADNLFSRPGARDLRPYIALAFGLIHGFGFAGVLREMGLPGGAMGWSLFSFNLGVEIGQLAVVLVVAAALAVLRSRNERAGRRLAFAGSVVVAAAGTFWFIERVFFSGGIS
jgi:hydrogenase/urease accessory protein HupE